MYTIPDDQRHFGWEPPVAEAGCQTPDESLENAAISVDNEVYNVDPELAELIDAWPKLPESVWIELLQFVRSIRPQDQLD